MDEVCPAAVRLSYAGLCGGGVFMVAGMAVPEEGFVISFGHVLVSPHSIGFSHTFSDGLTLLSGIRGGSASGFVHSYGDKDAARKGRSACRRREKSGQ
jgi:hypothetical protein